MRMLRQKRNKSYLWLSNLIKRLLIIVYQLSLFTSEAVFRRYSAKKKTVLKNLAKCTGKQLPWAICLDKIKLQVSGLQLC